MRAELRRWPTLTAGVAVALTGCVQAPLMPGRASHVVPSNEQCPLATGDRQWLQEALGRWPIVQRDFLKLEDRPFPHIITYDDRCSYSFVPGANLVPAWVISAHGGQVALPNGSTTPAAPGAFQAITDGRQNFVVMSLPSIWRPVAPESEIPLGHFLESVLFHELAHSYQSVFTPSVSLRALQTRYPFLQNLSDDTLQETFAANAAYAREIEAERDMFFRAAAAREDSEARELSCEALGKLRERRARYFTGANAHWAEVDELSVTMEGLAQWTAYTWLTRGRGLAASMVLPKLRSRSWSQDEGLPIFLLVDRLVPNWQKRLLGPSPVSAERLLALACQR